MNMILTNKKSFQSPWRNVLGNETKLHQQILLHATESNLSVYNWRMKSSTLILITSLTQSPWELLSANNSLRWSKYNMNE